MQNKKELNLNYICDLAECLYTNGYEEEWKELEELAMDINADCDKVYSLVRNIVSKLEWLENNWKDIIYEDDDNVVIYDYKNRMINMLNNFEDSKERYIWYKDIVKYQEAYLFYDNTLWRRMVRWQQRLWLSNLPKKRFGEWPFEYKNKIKNIKEHIVWMPRIEDLSLLQWCRYLSKGWIDQEDFGFKELIKCTLRKWYECPSLDNIKSEIEDSIKHINRQDWMPEEYQEDLEMFDSEWFNELFISESGELDVKKNVYFSREVEEAEVLMQKPVE